MESTLVLHWETTTGKKYDFFKLAEQNEENRPNINQTCIINLFPHYH